MVSRKNLLWAGKWMLFSGLLTSLGACRAPVQDYHTDKFRADEVACGGAPEGEQAQDVQRVSEFRECMTRRGWYMPEPVAAAEPEPEETKGVRSGRPIPVDKSGAGLPGEGGTGVTRVPDPDELEVTGDGELEMGAP